MQVVIVEDDDRIAAFLTKGLRAEGWTTLHASTVVEAESILDLHRDSLDLVLLDLGLPGGDGEDVLRRLRARDRALPVIVLTARAEISDRVRGLDAGANDYVTKPFAFAELVARIRAVHRSASQPSSAELTVGDLRLDLLAKVAWRAGHRIDLAPREWALLELFMRHPTQVLSRAQILSSVWHYDMDPGTNVVDVYVGYLRRKLNHEECVPLLHTVRGAGYRLARA
ncbi:MAG: two-component system, OmpR family, response regulator [Frankiaceae bacterium]|nr:two-component system, OmpR family, response regulator [Frankiaceae bacterium]MDQ1723254.1 two-component system, OmpR family, response regulator [Frankiaceae bacterium]